MARNVRRDWPAIEALSEPTRRRVHDVVREARRPMTRDEVAGALGIGRPLAAFHLDALAKAGLLNVDYARPPGRGGPGAGRPSKRYRTTADDIAVSVPERRYELVAEILATGVRDAGASRDVRAAVYAAARTRGEQLGARCAVVAEHASDEKPVDRVCAALDRLGYEPVGSGGAVSLRNCPFHGVVDVDPELVCGLNVQLVDGMLTALDVAGFEARFAPAADLCCVQVVEAPSGRAVG